MVRSVPIYPEVGIMTVTNGQQLRGKLRADIPYPVKAEVEYRLKQSRRIVEVGRSQTVSLSGGEVVLDSKRRLASGMEIDLILTWPVPLGTLGHLVLRIQGRTLASRGTRTKVEIGRYNFETRTEPNRANKAKPVKAVGTALPDAAPFAS